LGNRSVPGAKVVIASLEGPAIDFKGKPGRQEALLYRTAANGTVISGENSGMTWSGSSLAAQKISRQPATLTTRERFRKPNDLK
jgi:hypothetical protein